MNIKKAVSKLGRDFNTRNPLELTENLNIRTFYSPLGKRLMGFYMYQIRTPGIYINSNLSFTQQYVTAGMGLGHAILHRKCPIILMGMPGFLKWDKHQQEANKFCLHLFLPQSILSRYDSVPIEPLICASFIPEDYIRLLYRNGFRLDLMEEDFVGNLFSEPT